MDIGQLVKKHFTLLNHNDLQIWNYICMHKRECQDMSIYTLAQHCHVSHATVLRFTKKIGLKGYSDLKTYLRFEADKEMAYSEQSIDFIRQDYLTLYDYLKHKDCSNIFRCMDKAGKIYAYGTGQVQENATRELKRVFLSAHLPIYRIEGYTETTSILNSMHEGDVIFIFPQHTSQKLLTAFVKALHERKVHIVFIAKMGDEVPVKEIDDSIVLMTRSIPTGVKETLYESSTFYFMAVELLFLKYLEYRNKQRDYVM